MPSESGRGIGRGTSAGGVRAAQGDAVARGESHCGTSAGAVNAKGVSTAISAGEEPNEIVGLLADHPAIRAIAFNGQPAYRLFKRHVEKS